MSGTIPLRALLVEDNPEDCELLLRELRLAGFEMEWERVDNEAAYLEHLPSNWDIVISDYALPQFNGLRALELLKKQGWPIPFILVSGTIGEEAAAQVIKGGASDYLLKDRLTRLGPAVLQALEQYRLRSEHEKDVVAMREQADMLDYAHDAIIVGDVESKLITYWNKGAEHLYGWTAKEAVGRRVEDLIFQDPKAFAAIERQLMEKEEWHGEYPRVAKDGCKLVVNTRATLVRNASGRPKSVLTIDTDITEQRQLEAQFLRAQRMESIGTLAGGIAHDLNNVLAPILMAVQLLGEKIKDEEGRMLLSTLEASSQRGADLVRQVLSFARGVEGQRLTVDAIHLIRDIQKIVHDTFPKNITFTFKPGDDLWTVPGDPTQLHQVFMNLCVNARDAMTPQGGKLAVSMENIVLDETYASMNPECKAGAYLLVKVEDSGPGIDPEIRERIFEPFFTTKELGRGTGLGLSTTVAIIKSHEGFIQLYSEPGQGARFWIYLPANAGSGEAVASKRNLAELPRGRGELIMVVDDEENIRLVAQKTLEYYGYRVVQAVHGAEAVGIYGQRGKDIAVILVDMAMPVMDGPATIIALKAMDPEVKIIGSSGLDMKGDMLKASGVGVHHFIPKPYTAEVMLRVLRRVINGSA